MQPIQIRGRALAGGRLPALCIPLVARTADALLAEAAAAGAKSPDLLEWRVDFFEGIARAEQVAALAGRIRQAAGGIPVLFTRRSALEGGQPISLSEPQVVELYRAVCAGGGVDLVDYEMERDPQHIAAVRQAAQQADVGLLLSFHDFGGTPPAADLLARFGQAHRLGADIGKVAVMPRTRADVLALLQAVLEASERLPIPVAGMSMGALGAVTRLCGGEFGSALMFAVGQ
ncbi:MAG TPA: type I 3-dehydroquinate dehydratase, partial [Ramlibacter sp.]|nr:type I 3-dehydroquinate dehydratase [Ramlibacter sp.]